MNSWLAAVIALVAAAISTGLVLWLREAETHRPLSRWVVVATVGWFVATYLLIAFAVIPR
jgi:hypothetical protein